MAVWHEGLTRRLRRTVAPSRFELFTRWPPGWLGRVISGCNWATGRAEVLAASIQAVALLGVGAFVIVEGIQRLVDPPEINAPGLLAFGVLGLAGNLAAIGVLALSAVTESPRWALADGGALDPPGVRDEVTLAV